MSLEPRRYRREIRKPVERRTQILEGVMQLFTKQGYEATSMRDIARYLGVSLGLCYRYFASKEELFEEAMDQYAKTCCQLFQDYIEQHQVNISMMLQNFYRYTNHDTNSSHLAYHEFFHRIENKRLHEELSLRICKIMQEPIKAILLQYEKEQHIRFRDLDTMISFLTHGQIALISMDLDQQAIASMNRMIETILVSECIPE